MDLAAVLASDTDNRYDAFDVTNLTLEPGVTIDIDLIPPLDPRHFSQRPTKLAIGFISWKQACRKDPGQLP